MNYYFFLDNVINFYIISSISNQLYQFTGEYLYSAEQKYNSYRKLKFNNAMTIQRLFTNT